MELGFDTSQTESWNSQYDLLPPGDYHVFITEDRVQESRDGIPYLTLRYDIAEGPYKDRCFFDNLYFWSNNVNAKSIAKRKLKSIAMAIGYPNPDYVQDSNELVGGEMIINLKITPAKGDYDERNDIRIYKCVPKADVGGMPQPAAQRPGSRLAGFVQCQKIWRRL